MILIKGYLNEGGYQWSFPLDTENYSMGELISFFPDKFYFHSPFAKDVFIRIIQRIFFPWLGNKKSRKRVSGWTTNFSRDKKYDTFAGSQSEALLLGIYLILFNFIRISNFTPETFVLFWRSMVEGGCTLGNVKLYQIWDLDDWIFRPIERSHNKKKICNETVMIALRISY